MASLAPSCFFPLLSAVSVLLVVSVFFSFVFTLFTFIGSNPSTPSPMAPSCSFEKDQGKSFEFTRTSFLDQEAATSPTQPTMLSDYSDDETPAKAHLTTNMACVRVSSRFFKKARDQLDEVDFANARGVEITHG